MRVATIPRTALSRVSGKTVNLPSDMRATVEIAGAESKMGNRYLMIPRGLLVTKASNWTSSGNSGRSLRICSTACWRFRSER